MTTDNAAAFAAATALSTSRPRRVPRPIPIGEAAVRHDVSVVVHAGPNPPVRRLHSGVRLPDEAAMLFRRAVREFGGGPSSGRLSIVLERVTVETIAVREPNGAVVHAAQARAAEAVDHLVKAGPTIREALENMGRAWARHLTTIAEALEAQNKARAMGTVATGLEGTTPVVVLFDIAASHQGGNSRNGALIARALGIPFPITMPNLARRALEVGLEPRELWPWWGAAPRTMAEATAAVLRAQAHESDLCEGGCGRLLSEPCACPRESETTD